MQGLVGTSCGVALIKEAPMKNRLVLLAALQRLWPIAKKHWLVILEMLSMIIHYVELGHHLGHWLGFW